LQEKVDVVDVQVVYTVDIVDMLHNDHLIHYLNVQQSLIIHIDDDSLPLVMAQMMLLMTTMMMMMMMVQLLMASVRTTVLPSLVENRNVICWFWFQFQSNRI
jgi:hypothetical protein